MTTPLTMSAEQEATIRERREWYIQHDDDAGYLLAELDATRARLAEAEAALAALGPWLVASLVEHEAAAEALPDDHGDIHRMLVEEGHRIRALLAPERPA